jgi:hypothetical protein
MYLTLLSILNLFNLQFKSYPFSSIQLNPSISKRHPHAEAYTHHAQEDDIGHVKIPRWLRLYTKKDLDIEVRSGEDLPENLANYKLIVHCGGCKLTRHTMLYRINQAKLLDVPIVNYGVLISYMHGAILLFDEAVTEWEKKSASAYLQLQHQ